jgi:hypothetical protein
MEITAMRKASLRRVSLNMRMRMGMGMGDGGGGQRLLNTISKNGDRLAAFTSRQMQ